jgi:hypothetical protein
VLSLIVREFAAGESAGDAKILNRTQLFLNRDAVANVGEASGIFLSQ